MELKVDGFVEEIKDIITQRRDLSKNRNETLESIKNGYFFFSKLKNEPNNSKLITGSSRMMELISELINNEKQISDLDTILVSKMELYLGNFSMTVSVPEKMSDAGDIMKQQNIKVVSVKDDDMVEISPDDIWLLKMMKEALRVNNVSFEPKNLDTPSSK